MNEETLSVVQIINTDEADMRSWYKNKGGKHVIVVYDEKFSMYMTFNSIDDTGAIGLIEPHYCHVLTSYEWKEGEIC